MTLGKNHHRGAAEITEGSVNIRLFQKRSFLWGMVMGLHRTPPWSGKGRTSMRTPKKKRTPERALEVNIPSMGGGTTRVDCRTQRKSANYRNTILAGHKDSLEVAVG